MMTSNMNLRIGVLIIGSLIWDGKCHRQKWRNARLRICDRVHVTVPIRYGRKSSSRGDTYTMVFSKTMSSPEKMGLGIAVPCVRNVQCGSDFIDEAKALWAAEQSKKTNTGDRISAGWGCVGIVCNPNLAQESNIIKIKEEWSERVKSEIEQCSKSLYTCHKGTIIGADGILDIPWPRTEAGEAGEAYDGADILLATATDPTLVNGEHPSAETIADAWNKKGHICYFRENQAWGIKTWDDKEIDRGIKTWDDKKINECL